MTDYTNLVKALRYCKVDYCSSCLGCPMYEDYEGSGCINEMHDSAAAAIEDLQAMLTEADKKQAYQHDYVCELVAEVEELKAQLPKWGEWIFDGKFMELHKFRCSNCKRTEFRMSDYCPNCGADMRKMEVQDEA